MLYWMNHIKHQRRRSVAGDSGAARFLARRRAIKAGHKISSQRSTLFNMFMDWEDYREENCNCPGNRSECKCGK